MTALLPGPRVLVLIRTNELVCGYKYRDLECKHTPTFSSRVAGGMRNDIMQLHYYTAMIFYIITIAIAILCIDLYT